MDSLEKSVDLKDRYMKNLMIILDGGDPSVEATNDTVEISKKDQVNSEIIQSNPIDQKIREEYESEESDMTITLDNRFSDMLLFSPIDGYSISEKWSCVRRSAYK